MTKVTLIRCAQHFGSANGLYSGKYDYELTDDGVKQAEALGTELREIPYHYIISSKLQRSFATAEIIASINNYIPEYKVQNEYFNERSYGTVENSTLGYALNKYGQNQISQWRSNIHSKPPSGETFFMLYQRVIPFWQENIEPLIKKNKNILLVSHMHIMQCIITYLEDLPMEGIPLISIKHSQIVDYDF